MSPQTHSARESFCHATRSQRHFVGSGQSVQSFCQTRGLKPPTFYSWRLKLAKHDRQGEERAAFPAAMLSGLEPLGCDPLARPSCLWWSNLVWPESRSRSRLSCVAKACALHLLSINARRTAGRSAARIGGPGMIACRINPFRFGWPPLRWTCARVLMGLPNMCGPSWVTTRSAARCSFSATARDICSRSFGGTATAWPSTTSGWRRGHYRFPSADASTGQKCLSPRHVSSPYATAGGKPDRAIPAGGGT